jgi:hypothetical protein
VYLNTIRDEKNSPSFNEQYFRSNLPVYSRCLVQLISYLNLTFNSVNLTIRSIVMSKTSRSNSQFLEACSPTRGISRKSKFVSLYQDVKVEEQINLLMKTFLCITIK